MCPSFQDCYFQLDLGAIKEWCPIYSIHINYHKIQNSLFSLPTTFFPPTVQLFIMYMMHEVHLVRESQHQAAIARVSVSIMECIIQLRCEAKLSSPSLHRMHVNLMI